MAPRTSKEEIEMAKICYHHNSTWETRVIAMKALVAKSSLPPDVKQWHKNMSQTQAKARLLRMIDEVYSFLSLLSFLSFFKFMSSTSPSFSKG